MQLQSLLEKTSTLEFAQRIGIKTLRWRQVRGCYGDILFHRRRMHVAQAPY